MHFSFQFPSNGDSSQSSGAGDSPMVNGVSCSQYDNQQQQQQQQQQYNQQQQQQRKTKLFNINFRNGLRNGNSHLPASPPYAVVPSFLVTIKKKTFTFVI